MPRRLESITSGPDVSERILGYRPWIREDPALTDLDARWRTMDPFGDYRQVLTLAVPPLEELGGPAAAADLARAANDELAELVGALPGPLRRLRRGAADERRRRRRRGARPRDDASSARSGRRCTPTSAARRWTSRGSAPSSTRVTRSTARSGSTRPAARLAGLPVRDRSGYGIWWSLGWPYETSVAMARLVYSGCFDRYPGLRVITHHAGGDGAAFLGAARPRRWRTPSGRRSGAPAGRPHGLLPPLLRRHGDVRRAARGPLRGGVLRRRSHAVRDGHAARGPTVVADTIADIEALGLPRGRGRRHLRRQREEGAPDRQRLTTSPDSLRRNRWRVWPSRSDSGSYERLGAKVLSLPDVIAQSVGFMGPVFSSAFVIPLVIGVISASGKGGGRGRAAVGADRRGRRVRAGLDRVQVRQGDPRRRVAVRLRDPRPRRAGRHRGRLALLRRGDRPAHRPAAAHRRLPAGHDPVRVQGEPAALVGLDADPDRADRRDPVLRRAAVHPQPACPRAGLDRRGRASSSSA